LSEVSRENLLLRSEEFDNASWAKARLTVTANAIAAPDGTTTADKLIPNTDNNTHLARQVFTSTAQTYTASGYFKAGEYSAFTFFCADGLASTFRSVGVNLTTQSLTVLQGGMAGSQSILNAGNGWYKVIVVFTVVNAGVLSYVDFRLADGTPTAFGQSFAGNNVDGLFLWGAQLEAASTPSTYIPTTSAAVTRTADSAVIDGTGVLTGTYTMVEKPAGCAVVSGTNINLQPGFTAERVMVFPAALDAGQITAIRGAM